MSIRINYYTFITEEEFREVDLQQVKELTLYYEELKELEDIIGALINLEELNLYECPKEFSLPEEMETLTQLTRFCLISSSERMHLPKNLKNLRVESLAVGEIYYEELLELKHLKILELGAGGLNDEILKELSSLESLTLCKDYHIPNLINALQNLKQLCELKLCHLENKIRTFSELATKLPWLKSLSLNEYANGHPQPLFTLPSSIKQFTNLEKLTLIRCGINGLPDEFGELKSLKELEISICPINHFPEVITRLENLEVLIFGSNQNLIAELPETLVKLQKLRHFDHSGVHRYSFAEAPLPKVLGKLTNLHSLNLATAKVTYLENIYGLKKLRELSLDHDEHLVNLEPLLPLIELESLSLSFCEELHDLSLLKHFTKLKKLNLENVDDFDLFPVLTHPTLELLEANEAVVEKWKKRHELKDFPAVDEIMQLLKSDAIDKIEHGLQALSRHIQTFASDSEFNLLFNLFKLDLDLKNYSTAPIEIQELDELLVTNLKELSAETLIEIFGCTFMAITQNFKAAIIASTELAKRHEAVAQEKVIDLFIQASTSYEAGHREYGNTVHDHLIDEILPQFEAKPLIKLLEWVSNDLLANDYFDELFIPAFQKAADETVILRLLQRLLNYYYDEDSLANFKLLEKSLDPDQKQGIVEKYLHHSSPLIQEKTAELQAFLEFN